MSPPTMRMTIRRLLSVLLALSAVCMVALNLINLQFNPFSRSLELFDSPDFASNEALQGKLSIRQVFQIKHKAENEIKGTNAEEQEQQQRRDGSLPRSGGDRGEVAPRGLDGLPTFSFKGAANRVHLEQAPNGLEPPLLTQEAQPSGRSQIKGFKSDGTKWQPSSELQESYRKTIDHFTNKLSNSSLSSKLLNVIASNLTSSVIRVHKDSISSRYIFRKKHQQRRHYAMEVATRRSDGALNNTSKDTRDPKGVSGGHPSDSHESTFPHFYPGRKRRRAYLFPDPDRPHSDRVVEQLQFVSSEAQRDMKFGINKIILTFSGSSGLPEGRQKFTDDKCPVNACYLTWDVRWAQKADAVIFNFDPGPDTWTKPSHQVWLLSLLESPLNTPALHGLTNKINWTASYRSDSTLVTPYEKFVPNAHETHANRSPNTIKTIAGASNASSTFPIETNHAQGKTRLVAWFVSNCNARNKRMAYVRELQKHIQVDIYGACGPNKCSKVKQEVCLNLLRQHYKFYLAFENSNCQYYITEKFFSNALR